MGVSEGVRPALRLSPLFRHKLVPADLGDFLHDLKTARHARPGMPVLRHQLVARDVIDVFRFGEPEAPVSRIAGHLSPMAQFADSVVHVVQRGDVRAVAPIGAEGAFPLALRFDVPQHTSMFTLLFCVHRSFKLFRSCQKFEDVRTEPETFFFFGDRCILLDLGGPYGAERFRLLLYI